MTQTNPFVSRRSVPPQNLASFGDFSGLRSAMYVGSVKVWPTG